MKQNYVVIRNTYNKETHECVNMQIVNRVELDKEELQQYVSLMKVCNNMRTNEYFNEEYKKYFILPDPKETKEFAQFDTVNILFKDIDLNLVTSWYTKESGFLEMYLASHMVDLDFIICDTEITKILMRNLCYEKDEDIDKYIKGYGYFYHKSVKDHNMFNKEEENTFKTHMCFFNVRIKELFKYFTYDQLMDKMKILCFNQLLQIISHDYNKNIDIFMKTEIGKELEDCGIFSSIIENRKKEIMK